MKVPCVLEKHCTVHYMYTLETLHQVQWVHRWREWGNLWEMYTLHLGSILTTRPVTVYLWLCEVAFLLHTRTHLQIRYGEWEVSLWEGPIADVHLPLEEQRPIAALLPRCVQVHQPVGAVMGNPGWLAVPVHHLETAKAGKELYFSRDISFRLMGTSESNVNLPAGPPPRCSSPSICYVGWCTAAPQCSRAAPHTPPSVRPRSAALFGLHGENRQNLSQLYGLPCVDDADGCSSVMHTWFGDVELHSDRLIQVTGEMVEVTGVQTSVVHRHIYHHMQKNTKIKT